MGESISLIFNGFGDVFSLYLMGIIVLGICLGITFGALPGLSGTTGMALLLPLTYGLNIKAGLLMLAGVYCGAVYGGSISAILVGIPGTAAALPTTFDGFPMTKKGKAYEALLFALYASGFGGIISALVLMFLTPVMSVWALKFGPPEIFALSLWGVAVVASIVGKDIVKGLIPAVLGLIVSSVGADPVEGFNRFIFGNFYLIGGFHLVPLVLGTLAMPRVFEMIESINQEKAYFQPPTSHIWFLKPLEIFKYWLTLIKSAVIGVVVGIAPAAGPTIAAFIAYNEARRASKNPKLFGTGIPEGIVACETSNNAATGGSLVLALSLGIPGSAAAAVLVGALVMKGIQPGPLLLRNNPETIYTFFVGFLIVNILLIIIGHLFVQIGYFIILTPLKILAPVIFITCVIGAYSSSNNMFNVYIMLIVGLIAYILVKLDYPMAPFLLAVILSPIIESNLWVSYLITYGNLTLLFKRPLFVIILLLVALTLLAPILVNLKRNKKVTS